MTITYALYFLQRNPPIHNNPIVLMLKKAQQLVHTGTESLKLKWYFPGYIDEVDYKQEWNVAILIL